MPKKGKGPKKPRIRRPDPIVIPEFLSFEEVLLLPEAERKAYEASHLEYGISRITVLRERAKVTPAPVVLDPQAPTDEEKLMLSLYSAQTSAMTRLSQLYS